MRCRATAIRCTAIRPSPRWSAFRVPSCTGLCSYGTACRAVLSTRRAVSARTHQAVRCAFLQAGISGRDPGGGAVAGRRHDFLARQRKGASRYGRPNNGQCVFLNVSLLEDPIEAAEALIAARQGRRSGARSARPAGDGPRRLAGAAHPGQGAAGGGRHDRSALAEAREAVSLNPNVAPAVLALGEALLAAELLPTAIAELQRALRLDPGLVAGARTACRRLAEGGRSRQGAGGLGELDDPPAEMIAARCKPSRPRRAPTPAMSAISSISSRPITTAA